MEGEMTYLELHKSKVVLISKSFIAVYYLYFNK